MKRMIWYEWKRIWGSRLTQFAVLGCALFLAFSACSNIRLISETDADGQKVTGLEAVQLQKENRKEVTLDQETVDAVADEYLAYTEDPATSSDDRDLAYLSEEMYVKWYLPNLPVLHLIDGAYRTYPEQRNDPMRDVFLQSRGKDFSEARKERVWENLENAVSRGEITAEEADWWDTKDDAVGEMSYVYNRAWWEIINSASLTILVMLVVCIGTAPVFAGEYQSKCDSLLLSMRYGKNRLILAKLTSSFLFTTVVYWGCMGLFAGIYLAVLGTDGWDFPVQALGENVSISYDLTSVQACGLVLAMGYVLTLGLAGVVLLLSSLMKNPYGVVITSVLFLCVPLFLSLSEGGYVWKHLLGLLPEKIADFGFWSYMVYRIGGMTVTWPAAAMIVNGVCAVLLSGLAYGFFRRHQVNK